MKVTDQGLQWERLPEAAYDALAITANYWAGECQGASDSIYSLHRAHLHHYTNRAGQEQCTFWAIQGLEQPNPSHTKALRSAVKNTRGAIWANAATERDTLGTDSWLDNIYDEPGPAQGWTGGNLR